MQVRYQMDDGCEIFFANTHMHKGHQSQVTFDTQSPVDALAGFSIEAGEYHRISLNNLVSTWIWGCRIDDCSSQKRARFGNRYPGNGT